MSLLHIIHRLKEVNTLTKHEQLVQGVLEALNTGELSVGDKLPSINKMVGDVGYARKTIVKAYEELKERGLVESKKLKGYFIISDETKVTLRIALLLFSFQRFQEEFYNAFRKELGKRYQIDVFFHHNNVSVFETIFNNIKGKYGMYVVAPMPDLSIRPLLESIDPQKLLIVDRYFPMPEQYSYISQEFEENTLSKLVELLPKIKKYKRFVLFFANDRDYPDGIFKAFQRFVSEYGINGVVEEDYEAGSLEKGTLYFCVSDTSLWELLRDCHNSNMAIGEDIGILSHNDHVVKEIAFGGITTISTDFKDMATMAAQHIKNNMVSQVMVTSKLFKRKSL
ncbi:GntR family transcriptional regulator [Zobellia galactanivorans]|uniref:GntR family transcriptional regulator n=1 Tax=Zobellia TaxID=112040 RepID=UPI000B5339A7|nr:MULTISPECIES: substrate-binding domain-containing protein [Zobellia]MBU3026400.1 GntR family transcriptional regulator [Zobellia galactanivorans]MDO6810067.1 GntR family transcriptional regulator [Zobellia galactanivorans]OWW27111.1 GntR family transcriptional regulator [Zobellia sp. OII3]